MFDVPRSAVTLVGRSLFGIALATIGRAQATVAIPCDRDNTLYEDLNGSFSNARGDALFVGVTAQGKLRRALLHFDVAAVVPAGARVLAAALTVEVLQSGATGPTPVGAHRLLRAWGEGTSLAILGGGGQGAPSTSGDATWVHSFYPATFWTSPGGDFAAVPSTVVAMNTSGTNTFAASAASMADVQAWLDQPTQNFGWLLKADETLATSRARKLSSREGAAVPTLIVSYLLPGQTGSWGTGCPVGGGTMTTAFVGAPLGGTTIQIQNGAMPPNSVGANFFALQLEPAGALIAPACRVFLPLGPAVIPGCVFATGTGAAASPLALPAGFPGQLVACQAVALDGSVLGFALGNAALLVLP